VAAVWTGRVAVFRFDATPAIGTGHAMRCLTLADALEAVGWRCLFAIRPETLTTVPRKAWLRERALILDEDEAAEPSRIGARFANGYDLLVVDHYRRGADFERASRLWARRILAINDLADRDHDADLLLDPTLGRSLEDYRPLVPPACRLRLGPRYALLRPQFLRGRPAALARRRAPGPVRRIFVSLGGTDPQDVTSRVLDGLAEAGMGATIDVVVGAAAPFAARVRAKAACMPGARVHVGVADIAPLMAEADLAFGAAGTATWERCCLGLPTLAVVLADNQRGNAAALQASGAARVLGDVDRLTPAAVAKAVRALAEDTPARAAMATASAAACDGLGTARMLLEFLPPVPARDGTPVTLRALAPKDADAVFDWQQDPETRRFAREPRPPTRAEHGAWMVQACAAPDRLPVVVTLAGEPAGLLRLDRMPASGAFEVSILTAPGYYRRGLAAAALALARRLLPEADFHAFVKPENAASHALFRAAGYRPGPEGYYISQGRSDVSDA
jgi:UDP-2,4-diacetamido-2,4,6-trideoxy-beta-L-altropyranose hydrolase